MTVLKRGILLAVLTVILSAEDPTNISPSESLLPSSEPELSCSCMPCDLNPTFYTQHTQTDFCNSAAVIQGRVTQKITHSKAAGLWSTKKHTEHFKRGFPPRHFELRVRVLAVYSNRGNTKLSVGDKITVRYERDPSCPSCMTLVENFHNETWKDRDMIRGEKYVFFLPMLEEGYGDRPEASIAQCTRVWRYSKRFKVVEGWVPLVQRYMLTSTNCDKCRVSSCYQNKCVKVEEHEECTDPGVTRYGAGWRDNACQAIMDHGLCFYHAGSDKCRWTSISDQGHRSRKTIEECLPDDES